MADAMDGLIGKLKVALATGPTTEEIATFAAYLGATGIEAPQYASLRQAADDIMIHLYLVNPIRRYAARVVNEFEQAGS